MSNIPADLLYTEDDEWVKIEDGVATIGITDYAQDQLSDIVYLELPDTDETITTGETFGVVESVKAASDLYAPVTGVVAESNEGLVDAPETLNSDPYGDGWMIKVNMDDPTDRTGLMDAAAYGAHIDARA